MEAKTNYTFVGAMVISLITGFIIIALWLSIGFDSQSYKTYGVYMQEAVFGLSEDSLVKYNGVKVGYVDKIKLNKNNPQEVYLQLRISADVPITTSTQASLIIQGITGNTYLGLSATSASLTPLTTIPGQNYPIIPYKKSFLNQLEKNLTDISNSLRHIFVAKNEARLSAILQNLATITSTIAQNKQHIDESLRELPKLVIIFEQTLQQFKIMAKDVSSAGTQVSTTMQAGKRSVDAFAQQAIPPAVVLLHRLDNTAKNLEQISRDLRDNPTILVRGRTPPRPGPGE